MMENHKTQKLNENENEKNELDPLFPHSNYTQSNTNKKNCEIRRILIEINKLYSDLSQPKKSFEI